MSAKEEAKNIYDKVYQSGKGTDYFWSNDYEKWCKEKAICIASKECVNNFQEVKNEIEIL